METLIWKGQAGTPKNLSLTAFKSEEEFETAVFETPGLLQDIYPLKRQVRGGNKSGIPDIIGLDKNGNVCIIEMKNVNVDASIVPQVLGYAIWAETNPDALRILWMECTNKPDEVSVNWNGFGVRIIVIAPSIERSTLAFVKRINYPVDLIEVNRWTDAAEQFLLVRTLEPESEGSRVKVVSGQEVYDQAYFEKYYNKDSVKEFFRFAAELEAAVERKKWSLQKKFTQTYCTFKSGFFGVFGIQWVGTKTFAFFVKVSEATAKHLSPHPTRYQPDWKQALYNIDPKITKTEDYVSIFEAAYKQQVKGE
jgi:hypothetical protein